MVINGNKKLEWKPGGPDEDYTGISARQTDYHGSYNSQPDEVIYKNWDWIQRLIITVRPSEY